VVLLAMRSDVIGEMLAALRSRPPTVEVELPALQREESDRLVAALCTRRPAPDELDRIWQLGAGNPFFTTELAATLARGGAVQIPLTISAAVAARLSGMDRNVVDALRRVAVAGAPGGVDVDEFVALTGLVDDAAFTALDQALAAGVLVVDGDAYRFRHALVARTLAESVPPHRRHEVHRAAAQRLVARGGPAARIARHLDAGGRPQESVRWHLEAALSAGAVGAYADALGHIETGLRAEPGREDLLALRADYRFASGDPTAPLAYAQAAAAATGIRRDELRLRQAWALLMGGDLSGSMASMQGIVPGETTRLRLTLTTGLVDWFTGRLAEAERAAGETMRLALASGDTTEVLDSALLHALVAHSRGRWAQQLQLDLLDPRFTGVLAGMLSDAHLCVGELYLYGDATSAEVIDFAGRLRGVAADAGAVRGVAFATTLLGEAQLLAGDLDPAEEHLLEGARAHRALGARGGEAIALHALAELALKQQRRPAVGALLDEALRAARLSPLSARHLLTRIYGTRIRAAPDDATALSVLDEAQANLVRPAEACPLCWVPFLLPAADLLTRTGSPDAAEPLLASAGELIDVLWSGGGRWSAALAEGKAALARARKDPERAASSGDDRTAGRLA
jgi:tetratricopeptide (TPR) repeat protein